MVYAKRIKIGKYLRGVYNLSPITDKEPFFSKIGCPCCSDDLAGERYTFTAIVGKSHDGERIELNCCVDCYVWLFT
ncbi:hypothetical protein LCGC14_2329830 [marine sediment metagenome]|uniref:Uncharacterized protein n=1 Tax=marine sediment metagenome TaxID=412755 RepID=A0A0F9CF59_9ZZZZ